MVLPGYVGDAFGLLLIFKFTQNLFVKLLLMVIKKKNNSSVIKENDSEVVEGEFFDLNKKNEINK